MYQNLFLYRCSKNTSIETLEKVFSRIEDRMDILIRDISRGAEEERANVFSSVIAALHKRESSGHERPLLTVLKTGETEYFMILSLPAFLSDEDVRSYLAGVFGSNNYEALRLLGGTPHTKEESEAYWSEILESDETSTVGNIALARCVKERNEEILTVSPTITASLRDPANSRVNLESLCATIWGTIACKYFETENILIECKHENGKLFRIPVKVDTASTFVDSYAFSEMQFRNALDYDNLLFSEVENALPTGFANVMAFSVGFYNRYRYAPLFKSLRAGIPYKLRHLESSNLPFRVYCYYCDTVMRIRYNYDVGMIKHAGIYSMHKAFCQLLERFLYSKNSVDVNKIVLRPDKDSPEQRRTEFVKSVLSRNEIFKFYSLEELNKFCAKCKIESKFAEETILESGKQSENLYILTSGKIVVETVGKDRNVKMILVLRPGNIFGIECLLSDPTVDFTYRAVTEIVDLIKIPGNSLKSELALHPKLNTVIMNIQNNRLNKLAKLLATKDIK